MGKENKKNTAMSFIKKLKPIVKLPDVTGYLKMSYLKTVPNSCPERLS
jgi:hypothetical protein